jgi:glycosyltransferase involved in cell wall biosynthesis
MPVALLEAMALARPVVASAVGGIPEIVANEGSGLLIDPKNVEELTEALQRLTQHPALRLRLGQMARQVVVREFSVERMMSQYAALYREVIGGEPTKVGWPMTAASMG